MHHKKGNILVLSFFILQAMQLTRYNYYTNKLGFVVLELALLCGRYLELAETIQPSLCKGRGSRSGGRIVLVGTLDYIRFIRYMM